MLSSSCTYQSSTYVFRDLSMYKKNFEMNVLTEFSIFQNIFKLVRLIFISKRALVRFAFERKVGEKIKMTKILLRTQSQLLKSSRLSTHLDLGNVYFVQIPKLKYVLNRQKHLWVGTLVLCDTINFSEHFLLGFKQDHQDQQIWVQIEIGGVD